MTVTVRQVREGMAEAITVGTGLRADPIDGDVVNAPCAHVSRAEYNPEMVFGGSKSVYMFKVRAFMPRTADVAAIRLLDEYAECIGDRSIVAAIKDDTNWPTTFDIDYAKVVLVSEVREVQNAGGGETYLMVEFDVEVVW